MIPCTGVSYGYLSIVSFVCCQVEVLRRADLLYRGVLWMSVCCECCVLSGRDLCDRLITYTDESYGYLSAVSVVCCHVGDSASG